MLMLNVNSKKQTKKVKRLGAKLNQDTKKWYVENGMDYLKFAKWIDGNYIVKDCLYVIEAETVCPRCTLKTPVIGFGVDNYYELYDGEEYDESSIQEVNNFFQLISEIHNLPIKLEGYLEAKYNYQVINGKPRNYCIHCNAMQNHLYLFSTINQSSPFFLLTPEDAEKLNLYKIKLPHDWAFDMKEGWMSTIAVWFKEYGKVESLSLRIM